MFNDPLHCLNHIVLLLVSFKPTDDVISSQLSSCVIKLVIAMHHTAFVPYSVTAGCSLTDSTNALLPVL